MKPPPPTAKTRECTGALVLQQREVMVLQRLAEPLGYVGLRGRFGMTLHGLASVVARVMPGPTPMAKPDLSQEGVELGLGETETSRTLMMETKD